MKEHRIGAAVGILLLGFTFPFVMHTFPSAKMALIMGYLWGVTVFPFTIYLGVISGKYFRKMWFYPVIYGTALLGVHIYSNGGHVNPENVGILIAMAVVSTSIMLIRAMSRMIRGKR